MNFCSRSTFSALILFLVAQSTNAAEPLRLTEDGLLKRDPVYVEQGQAVVYSVRHASPQMVLNRVDLANKKTKRLIPKSNLVEFGASYSADGKTMALMRMTGNDELAMFVGDSSDGELRAIRASRKVVWNGTITPDGLAVV